MTTDVKQLKDKNGAKFYPVTVVDAIPDLTLSADNIGDGTITTPKLANKAVTTEKIDFASFTNYIKNIEGVFHAPTTVTELPNSRTTVKAGKYLALLVSCYWFGLGNQMWECDLRKASDGALLVHNGFNAADSKHGETAWSMSFNIVEFSSDTEVCVTHMSSSAMDTESPRYAFIKIG